MNLRVVLVEPEYSGNIGFICRVMKNFGVKELFLVNPKASFNNGEAKSRAMKAQDILSNVVIVNSLKKAISNCVFVVGLTAKYSKKKGLNRTVQSLKEFSENHHNSGEKTALVFGTEKNGLTNEQLNECDFLVTIPTNKNYKSMNLSHAVAVTLYALNSVKKREFVPCIDLNLKKQLIFEFNELIHSGNKIRQKQKTLNAFKAFLLRARITQAEAKAILSVFKSVNKRIKFKKS